MLEFDKKSNLLMTNRYQYSLQDVAEPNLYRELYDYESIPKVAFNMRHVPENMPDEIWMTDTTFRDGQQSSAPLTVKQIVDIYKLFDLQLHLSTLPQLRGRLARLPFGCNGIMGIFTPARFSACRPHCVNYDWTEVSLRPHLSLRSTPPRGVYQRLNRSCPVAVMARTLSALPYS